MAVAGLIVTVLIAIGTWAITQHQARQATRRNMRIDYLLEAYRRLDRASNRPLTPAAGQDLEAAISDIILLGSPNQAQLATQFAATFAAEHAADAIPLLRDLRASLRRELLLEELPPSAYVALRVGTSGDTALHDARIWREATRATRQALAAELAEQHLAADLEAGPDESGGSSPTDPSAVVAASTQQLEHALRVLLAAETADDHTGLSLAQLANRALQHQLIDPQLADSLNGLAVMHLLAVNGQDRLDSRRASEYASLAAASQYLVNRAHLAPTPTS
jgi:hypothetical protein